MRKVEEYRRSERGARALRGKRGSRNQVVAPDPREGRKPKAPRCHFSVANLGRCTFRPFGGGGPK